MSGTCDYCGCPLDGDVRFAVTVEVGAGEFETDLCSEPCLTAYAVMGPLQDVKRGGRS